MKLATLAALLAVLLAVVPQARGSEANLENLNLDPVETSYRPAQVEQTIVPDQPEPTILELDVR
ncbi:MAG: hypothetical protein ACRDGN_07020 [bacterium]